ncbi:MAG: hypothetical protein U1D30_20015 [Planctomycetota bacterium]
MLNAKQQLYVIASSAPGGMDNVHGLLEEGWRAVREIPMGAGGTCPYAYALVFMEKEVSKDQK